MEHDIVFEMDQAVHRLANRLQDHPIVGKVLDGTANRRTYVTFLKATYLYEGFFGSDAYLEDPAVRPVDRRLSAGNAGRRTRRPPRGMLEGVASDRALHVNTA